MQAAGRSSRVDGAGLSPSASLWALASGEGAAPHKRPAGHAPHLLQPDWPASQAAAPGHPPGFRLAADYFTPTTLPASTAG